MYFAIYKKGAKVLIKQYNKQVLLEEIPTWDESIKFCNGLSKTNLVELDDDAMEVLIIKGEIVVPKPKKVIETYEID